MKMIYFLSLKKSFKNEKKYIDYAQPLRYLDKFCDKGDSKQRNVVCIDMKTFLSNKTVFQDCSIVVVKEKDLGLNVNFENEKQDLIQKIYPNCHIQCIDLLNLSVLIKSLKNNDDVKNIIFMGTNHFFQKVTEKNSIQNIYIQLNENRNYTNYSQYEEESKRWENNLELFDPKELRHYFLENYTNWDNPYEINKVFHENNQFLNVKPKYYTQFLIYNIDKNENKNESQYLKLLSQVLDLGNERDDRTNVGTISLFGTHLHFDISQHIPLLTTKKMAWKSIIKELIWFLSGNTNSKILESQNVKIWSQNSSRDFLDKRGLFHYKEGDIGPLYPFSFRHFNAQYEGCDKSYKNKGYDQWCNLLHGIKTDPFSRRHLMTTFNPSVTHQCVLPPCHGIAIQFYVEEVKKEKQGKEGKEDEKQLGLKCHVYCRSSDAFLGLPFNIASYSILTYIVAKLCDLQPLELILSMGDTHIYKNHISQVQEQLERDVLPSPSLIVSNAIKDKDISDVKVEDFSLVGYFSHEPISAHMAV